MVANGQPQHRAKLPSPSLFSYLSFNHLDWSIDSQSGKIKRPWEREESIWIPKPYSVGTQYNIIYLKTKSSSNKERFYFVLFFLAHLKFQMDLPHDCSLFCAHLMSPRVHKLCKLYMEQEQSDWKEECHYFRASQASSHPKKDSKKSCFGRKKA